MKNYDMLLAVGEGAAFLDEVRPGWHNEIDLDELNLSVCSKCILGQLYDQFMIGMHKLQLVYDDVVKFGLDMLYIADLNIDTANKIWDNMTKLWIEAIEKRRTI